MTGNAGWDELFAKCNKAQLDILLANDSKRVRVNGCHAVLLANDWITTNSAEGYVVKVDSRCAEAHEAASEECQQIVDTLDWRTDYTQLLY